MITLRYITALSYPSKYVNRMQVVKMSEGFSARADTTLLVASLADTKENVFQSYGVTRAFPIEVVGVSRIWPRSLWYALRMRSLIHAMPTGTVFYIRDIILAFFLTRVSPRFRSNFFFECHSLGKFPRFVYRHVFSSAQGVISTNTAKKNMIMAMYHIPEDHILVAPNGYDEALFANLPDQNTVRKELGLPLDRKIIMYVGSMQKWKGVDLIRGLAEKNRGYMFVIVGGNLERVPSNVLGIPSQPYAQVPQYMRAADVLMAPYQGNDERVRLYFSPVKIFEYMASGTPFVTSQHPAIQEIVMQDPASPLGFFAAYSKDPVESFSSTIRTVLDDAKEAGERAENAREAVKRYNWKNRAEIITQFMESLA